MTKQADLIAYLFEGPVQHRIDTVQLSHTLMEWMEASSRFTAFVEVYRDKIRKKIRVTRDAESLLDLRSELEVAYRLLNDRRLALAYEPYASEKRRGPDFAVTYRANLVFHIEVARLRGEESSGEAIDLPVGNDLARSANFNRSESRILRILLNKFGQMQPGMANALVIHTREDLAKSIDLSKLMQVVKARAEGKDPSFYAASRYPNPAAFYKDFARLSGILLIPAGEPAAQAKQLWVNKQARPTLDEKILRLVSLAL